MGPSKRNSQTGRYLRADIPRVEADDRFIAVLADLAASSTPAADHSRVGSTALPVKIAAVIASVALVSVGAAYAVDRLGGDGRAPVGPTHTVDPASPSEPDERFEEDDEDLAPHDLDEGPEHHPNGTGNSVQDHTVLPDSGVEGSQPEVPAPQGQGGQDGAEQDQTDPKVGGSQGSPAPDDSTDPANDSSGPADDADPRPEVDPADRDTDADPSDGSGSGGTPDANLDSDARVDGR